ncbi:MAG: hypothetical protein JNN00_17945 [Chitinophagaceae bacterium]|nr:hypothetical protein [Chitinophagaceae bacterium]
MRFLRNYRVGISAIILLTFFSCSKKEEFVSEPISDYIPLQTGKYITYRLDSLVFTNFGSNTEIHRYQVKHEVDQQITDNLGRPSWRVFTYIRDSAGTQPWVPNGSYFITPTAQQTELIEDNLRVIKMHLPIREGFQWHGNSYMPDEPYGASYDFSNDIDIENWDFTYDVFESEWTYRNQTYGDVVTVEQQDESENAPVTNVGNYGYKNRSVEKYSKSIGLVYRQYELWEYQPNPSGTPYTTGFGITLWMIDHN